MKYELQITPRAAKELSKLHKTDVEEVRTAIAALANEPRPAGCKKLRGVEAWRIRIGDYRVIYEIHNDKLLIIVFRAGHRSSVYE